MKARTFAPFLACALACVAFASEYSLSFFQGRFIVRKGEATSEAQVDEPEVKPTLFVAYRRDDAWAVWDDRGLTLRKGKRAVSTRLKEIGTSPKLQEHNELKKSVQLIRKGDRTAGATALSGSKRIGDTVYFLLRWDDTEGKPWLEALVKVDLSEPKLIPHLVGKFSGLSMAKGEIDDKLIVHKSALGVITKDGDTWGEALYATSDKVFSYRKLGMGLKSFKLDKSLTGLFVDSSSYGATLAGLVDLKEGTRDEAMETRGTVELVGDDLALIGSNGTKALRNLKTGAELLLTDDAQYRLTPEGVIVFWGGRRPKRAVLYHSSDWSTLATWN